jgi:hypothetical protein
MSIPESETPGDRYTANGIITQFTGTFKIDDPSEVEVLEDLTVKVLTEHYTLAGVGNSQFTVTIAPVPVAGKIITILRKQPLKQASIYTPNEDFPAGRLEGDFDDAVKATQMIREMVGRAVKFSKKSIIRDKDLPDPVSGQFLRWAADGSVENATIGIGAIATPVAIANGGTAGTTAAEARTNLGITLVDAFSLELHLGFRVFG